MHTFTMSEVVAALNEATRDFHVTVCVGVGTHQSVAARGFTLDYPRRQLLTSCGHGTMGSALPYAIGAQLANPERLVLVVTGDGCWEMERIHLTTCRAYSLPVKVAILDNGVAGIVHQFEELNGIPHVATEWARGRPGSKPESHLDMGWLWDPGVQVRRYVCSDIGVWPILQSGHQPDKMTSEPRGIGCMGRELP
jgi:TPP-dependent trihydroxycyclohexane-1,2-dione (THcHDO) dehydratase